jgi:hypothetical protein
LYQNALDILSKRRWSATTQIDLRTAYVDLQSAAQLGHPDAEKILGIATLSKNFYLPILAFSYLFGDFRWSIDDAKNIFETLAAKGSPNGHLGLGFLYSTGMGLSKPNPAQGFVHYLFAALGGNPLAQMALVLFQFCFFSQQYFF